jgi:F-type H+-transporting ATPase subunit c
VNRLVKLLLLSFVVALVFATPVLAAGDEAAGKSMLEMRYIGVGLVVIGAAYGIGRLASHAYDGMSRQPEVAGSIQTAMIIAAALIEGFTFYALYICMAY